MIPKRFEDAKIDMNIKLDLEKSWYLFGLTGCGKTHYCYAVKLANNQTISVFNYVLVSASLRNRHLTWRDWIENFSSDFIIIDDLGSELRTDYSNDLLFRILNSRYEHMRWTGITSNLPVKELPYEDRIKSRILGIVGENRFNLATKDRRVE